MSEGKWIAVDLDGVLAEYDGWEGVENIGAPHRGAAEFMRELQDRGYRVVVHTTRTNPDPFYDGEDRQDPEALRTLVWGWLTDHGLDEFVTRVFAETGKPIAAAYVDDRAVTCRPNDGHGTTEFGAALEQIETLT